MSHRGKRKRRAATSAAAPDADAPNDDAVQKPAGEGTSGEDGGEDAGKEGGSHDVSTFRFIHHDGSHHLIKSSLGGHAVLHAHEHDRPPRSLPAAPATHRGSSSSCWSRAVALVPAGELWTSWAWASASYVALCGWRRRTARVPALAPPDPEGSRRG
jgi:hypothetical protein